MLLGMMVGLSLAHASPYTSGPAIHWLPLPILLQLLLNVQVDQSLASTGVEWIVDAPTKMLSVQAVLIQPAGKII